MTLTEVIVSEFIEYYLQKNETHEGSRKRKRNGENNETRQVNCSKQERLQSRKIIPSLIRIVDDFDRFVGDSNGPGDRFKELTTPLVPLLTNIEENPQRYSDAFNKVADQLFSPSISWRYIITLFVYNGELAVRVTNQLKNDAKISKILSLIRENLCKYIDNKALQWILQQEGGWLSIISYEEEKFRSKESTSRTGGSQSIACNENQKGNCIRQVVSVAAFAIVIGGLYMCSKLSAQ